MPDPLRGEIWMANLNPTAGHSPAGTRPALVVSANRFNASPADLVIVLPLSTKEKGVRSHVPINPPEGGVKRRSWIRCEDVRSVSKERLSRRWGSVSRTTLHAVEDRLRILMEL
jgi:mRNA interferase MazF